ncbi:DEAD/DEAH box helicase, partial [Desulfonatronospira sp.]|uniref:DEAD/DEAH box helicase n=1 Tax=Desulfonatronospira sp. TaxID=1962951 RepID=UPI0025C0B770
MDEQLSKIDELDHFEKKILQICALAAPIFNISNIHTLLLLSNAALPQGVEKAPGELGPYLVRLQEGGFLNSEFDCNAGIREIMARQASREPDFKKLYRTIKDKWPASRYFQSHYSMGNGGVEMLARDIRLDILAGDTDAFIKDLRFFNQYGDNLNQTTPLLSICTNPFDHHWMQTLPSIIQDKILEEVLHLFITRGINPGSGVVPYASLYVEQKVVSSFSALKLKFFLCCINLMSAKLDRVEELIPGLDFERLEYMCRGWAWFLKGDDDRSIAAFTEALADLRKGYRSKKIFFSDSSGQVYLLSLLRKQNPESLKKLRTLIADIESNINEYAGSKLRPALSALQAILHFLDMEEESAREKLDHMASHPDLLAGFICNLARFWVNQHLTPNQKNDLKSILDRAMDCGFDWISIESGCLLMAADPKGLSEEEQEFIQGLKRDTGIKPMADLVQPFEKWKMALQALQKTAYQQGDAAEGQTNRVAWLVEIAEGKLKWLQPKLQNQNKKGGWTKGRNIALKVLFHQMNSLAYLSNHDLRLLTALKRYFDGYRSNWYDFDLDRALLLLVGHPRVFRENDLETPVEFVRGEPEISVVKSGNGYQLSMSPDLRHYSQVAVQDTPYRYRVVQASDAHKRLAGILGNQGVKVPGDGRDELLKTISSLSGMVTIHSDLSEHNSDIPEVTGDSVPNIRIYPAGSGFKVDMVVRPFVDDGPFVRPGEGRAVIMAEVRGKRMLARRDLELEASKAAKVEAGCPSLESFDGQDQLWIIDGPAGCLDFLSELRELQEQGLVRLLWPEGEKLRIARNVNMDNLELELTSRQEWFEVDGRLAVDQETVLKLKELMQALGEQDVRYVAMDDKSYVALTSKLRRRLSELAHLSEIKKDGIRLPGHSILALEDLDREAGSFKGDKAWSRRKKEIREAISARPEPPSTLRADLRPYQVEGYQWLSRMARLGLGVCLADDMGLGKTLQALAVILERASQGPTLVVAPTSVCPNWISETRRFAPTLKPVLYAGRDRQDQLVDPGPFALLICSYALLMQDAQHLCRVEWQNVVLDEAQAIKNWSAKRTQAAMNLNARFRMATTGTPIENNLTELWTLFMFLNPGLLGPRKKFNERFVLPIQKYENNEQKKLLKRVIQPFILRRLKSHVLEELPSLTEVTLKVSLSQEETVIYEAMRQQALENLEKAYLEGGARHLQILTELTRLRQVCCHPRMVIPESEVPGSKLELLQEIVTELLANKHKALVFSQFVKHLSLVRERLDAMGIEYRYLDGSTPSHVREQEIQAFQEGRGDLFLISLKAGGLGLNLTAADYVIHLDPWWNPAVEDQATDRSHRIGQENPVTVYRLVAENTIEEKIVRLHAEKRDLADSLLEGTDSGSRVSAEELMQLL